MHIFSRSNRRMCSTHKRGQTGRKEALVPGNEIQPVSYAASLPGPTGARTPRGALGRITSGSYHLVQRADSLEKTLMLGEIEGRRRQE